MPSTTPLSKTKRAPLSKKKLALFASLGTLALIGSFLYLKTWFGYHRLEKETELSSEVAPMLKIFALNTSQHPDPISGCWYDSGDYIVFAKRNAESIFYLSLAYESSKTPEVKADLKKIIEQGQTCLNAMVEKNYKQFRDQDSHGINLPPFLNNALYPQRFYSWREDEGKDVFLMMAYSYKALGNTELEQAYRARADKVSNLTSTEQCCENGPLTMSTDEFQALQFLTDATSTYAIEPLWGIKFSSLARLKRADHSTIKGVLDSVQKEWDGSGKPFAYFGGNYDIAGTVALERLYARESGDETFKPLSDLLYSYLHGQNEYHVDFTSYPRPYHPCSFFHACSFFDTLINGVDESGTFNPKRTDRWKNTEIELVGQAKYIAAYVLYHDL